jgi:hypothetical protein
MQSSRGNNCHETSRTGLRHYSWRRVAVRKTAHAVGFLFKAPLILALLLVINWMTFSGEWWVRWAALGIGIAWVVSLFRVIRAVLLAGGLAALAGYIASRR